MRIIVFSDTHGSIKKCINVIEQIQQVDMIIHLGDVLRDVEDLKILYPDIPIEYICGNNDYLRTVPFEKVVEAEGKRIYITHGHLCGVKHDYDTVLNKGMSHNAHVVLFGHTHESYEAYREGIFIMNPGSISLPKWGEASYGIIEIQEGKIATCICNI